MEEVEWPATASWERRGLKVKREESEEDHESVWKRREDTNPDLLQSAAADCASDGSSPMEEDSSSSGSPDPDPYWPLIKLDVDASDLEAEDPFECYFYDHRAQVEERDLREFEEAISNPDLDKSLSAIADSSDIDDSATPPPIYPDNPTLSRLYRMNIEAYLLARGVPRDSKLMQYVMTRAEGDPLEYPDENVQRVFKAYHRSGWSILDYPEFDSDEADALYRCLELEGTGFVYDALRDTEFRHQIASYKGDQQYLTIYEDLLRNLNPNTTYDDAITEAYNLWEIDPVMPLEMVDIVATDALYQIGEEDAYKKDRENYFQLWTYVAKNKVRLFDAWCKIYGSEWDSQKLKKYLGIYTYQRQVSTILSIGDETSAQARSLVEKIVQSWHDLDGERLYVSYLRRKLKLACKIGIVAQEE